MNRAILDTDVLSYVIGRRYPEVDVTARQYERVFRYFTVTAITVSEVIAGYRQADDNAAISEFVRRAEGFEILPLEMEEAITAGQILGELSRTGLPIGSMDPFIAAIAIQNRLPLVTNNQAHYQRIVQLGFPLELENWRRP